MFDLVVQDAHKVSAPPVLYHYTSWGGAQGIVSSQRFWATAHDCTNDEAELVSADSIIIEVAKDLRKNATGAAPQALDLFLEGYPGRKLTKLIAVYLACFSAARDDEEQWRKYADDGRGVCLGIRVLDEPGPMNPNLGTALVKVDYSESSWRDSLTRNFEKVCFMLSHAAVSARNWELGLSALYRIAAFASIMAKRAEWAGEQEFRLVTIVRQNAKIESKERESAAKTIRYLPIEVRAEGKRITFAEIIIGSNQNAEDARGRLRSLLAANGYKADDIEYPEITVSVIPPWDHPTSE